MAFTPGGLRLASRAIEILGLQQQTAIEVTEAARGRRLLRIAASSAFAEHAVPGLIELFSSRADDLSVELTRATRQRARRCGASAATLPLASRQPAASELVLRFVHVRPRSPRVRVHKSRGG